MAKADDQPKSPQEIEAERRSAYERKIMQRFDYIAGRDVDAPMLRIVLQYAYDLLDPKADPVKLALLSNKGIDAEKHTRDQLLALSRLEQGRFVENSVGAHHPRTLWLDHAYCHPAYQEEMNKLENAADYWQGLEVNSHYADSQNNVPLTLFPGVTAVLGKSGSGKTRFVTNQVLTPLANRNDDSQVHYWSLHEPDGVRVWNLIKDNIPQNADVYTTCDTEAEFALGLFKLIYVEPAVRSAYTPRVAILDSTRYLFFSSAAGSYGKGGVSNEFFITLTDLDKFAQDTKTYLIVTLNPLTDSDEAINSYKEQLLGTVSNVFHCTKNDIKFHSRFLDRSELIYRPSARVFGDRVQNLLTSSPNISPSCFFYNQIGGING